MINIFTREFAHVDIVTSTKAVFSNINSELAHCETLFPQRLQMKFRTYYKDYADASPVRLRYYQQRLQHAVASCSGKRVLVVGSGLGTEVFLLKAAGAIDVVGIDIDPEFVELAKLRAEHWGAEGVSFEEEGVYSYHPAQHFDVVFVMETFHHIVPKDIFFSTVVSFLTDAGRVIVCEPNGEHPFIRWRLARNGWATGVVKHKGSHVFTDEMYMPMSVVVGFMERSGLIVEKTLRYRVLPGKSWKTLMPLFGVLDTVLERILPLRFFSVGYTVVGQATSTSASTCCVG